MLSGKYFLFKEIAIAETRKGGKRSKDLEETRGER